MANVGFAEGKPQEYMAEISFNLNLENKKSSKVQKGDKILYDGHVAAYTSQAGISISGESRSLKSAIQAGWLVLMKNGEKVSTAPEQKEPTKNDSDFDSKKGGNFDVFMKNDGKVIHEKDLIVKNTQPMKKSQDKPATGEKHEVAGDQVDVKKIEEPALMVNSTTTVARTKVHSKNVQASDSYGADNTRALNMKRSTEPPDIKKKKAFTVDSSTPTVQDGATLDEVKRAKGTEPMEDQGAKVVKKLKQGSMQVESMEGVAFKKTKSPKDMTITTKVSSGGDMAVDISTSADTKVVSKIEKPTEGAPVETAKTATSKPDYASMTPPDWKSMHWVKKEKWIKAQMDPKLLEYLLSVEDVNAVINACKERLKELAEG